MALRPGPGWLVALLLAVVLAGEGPAAAEVRTAHGTSKQARILSRSEVPLGDGTLGRLEGLLRVLESDAPEWRGAQVFSVRFSDPQMRQNRVMRGQMVITVPGGDQAFLNYDFTWTGGGVTTPFQLNGLFVHGTGRFAGIRGQWREQGLSTMNEDTSEWEVTYELK